MSQNDPHLLAAIRERLKADPSSRQYIQAAYPQAIALIDQEDAAKAGVKPTMLPGAPLTVEALQQVLREQFDRMMPGITGLMEKIDAIFKHALPPGEYAQFNAWLTGGAPGLSQLAANGDLAPIAQLLWETVKPKPAPTEAPAAPSSPPAA